MMFSPHKSTLRSWSAVVVAICAIGYCAPVAALDIEIPTFLYTSGSARLIGMGDASVAMLDPSASTVNPAILALSLDDEMLRSEIHLRNTTDAGASYTTSQLALSINNLASIRSNWNFVMGYSRLTATVPTNQYFAYYYYDPFNGFPRPVYYPYVGVRGRGANHTITASIASRGKVRLGIGTAIRRMEVDGRELNDWYTSDVPISSWNVDFGLAAGGVLTLLKDDTDSRLRSVTITPSLGLSRTGVIRSKVSHFDDSAYVAHFPNWQSPAPSEEFKLGFPLTRIGSAITIRANGTHLILMDLTGSAELQSADEYVDGSRFGVELRLLESIAVRKGYGLVGIHRSVHSYGMSISTAGLQHLLFREPDDPSGSSDVAWLLRRLHVSLTYANCKLDQSRVSDLPEDFWALSISL